MNKATVASLKACHLVKIETELTNMTQATMPGKKIRGLRQRTVIECQSAAPSTGPTVSFHKLFFF